LADGSAIDLCREAKALSNAPAVLVTTEQVERVPDALEAGCDGVLLKPFASNLLFARIGRLLRDRSTLLHRSSALRDRSAHIAGKIDHLRERSTLLKQGTNRVWPTIHCPHCDHAGVTSFEFASHRRAWYACLQCRKVWIGKRQE
jgi:DNA-binding response OmpR family regulator